MERWWLRAEIGCHRPLSSNLDVVFMFLFFSLFFLLFPFAPYFFFLDTAPHRTEARRAMRNRSTEISSLRIGKGGRASVQILRDHTRFRGRDYGLHQSPEWRYSLRAQQWSAERARREADAAGQESHEGNPQASLRQGATNPREDQEQECQPSKSVFLFACEIKLRRN